MEQKKELKIDLATAKNLYKTATNELKIILEETFGKKELSNNPKDIINSYEDACSYLNEKILSLKDFIDFPSWQRDRMYAIHQIEMIIKCFNGSWVPNFSNSNQYKYRCYFERKKSGWVLCTVGNCSGGSNSGSGFYFEKRENAEFIGTKFINIFSRILE